MEFLAHLGPLVPLAIAISAFWYHLVTKLAKIEVKVDTLWDFQIRKSYSEALSKGMGTVNSPFILTTSIRSAYDTMASDLQKFYKTRGHKLSDRELYIAIEKEFGERLLNEVCLPNGMVAGPCITCAIEVAKE